MVCRLSNGYKWWIKDVWTMSIKFAIQRAIMAFILLAAAPSNVLAELSDEQQFALSVGMTAGSLKTVCALYEGGILTEEETSLYIQGFLESVEAKEQGASLAGSLKGYEVSKNQHPNCPIP